MEIDLISYIPQKDIVQATVSFKHKEMTQYTIVRCEVEELPTHNIIDLVSHKMFIELCNQAINKRIEILDKAS